ncbi:hypothetical protein [Streptomyces sp. H27-D2]|uniref:hypothetical protein n=1 Tax=Streptomyces sp. H27-D2 TaxID=3046304 RepID=UPI002DB5AB99|nr:hypothetical protein [Streptomyces sp. H27-D2]MEC4016040.1 hypothetical protein [Streptomyces sp. H27-D2]
MSTPRETITAWLDKLTPAASVFTLRRDEDVTGVSGTGVVADGVLFPAAGRGVCVVRWRGERGSTVVWDHLGHVKDIHGHDGRTVIEVVPVGELIAALRAVAAIEPATRERYGDTEAVDGWNDALGEVHCAIADAIEDLHGHGDLVPPVAADVQP